MNCPECGAPNNLCQTRFDEFLALEFSDLRYGAVHNLTVATFMLQHSSRMSKEGWLYERELLREFIVNHKSPDLIRQQTSDKVDSGMRTFKFKSKDGRPVINKTAWRRTILDVRAENPEVYCEDIAAWARSALEEAEAIGDLSWREIAMEIFHSECRGISAVTTSTRWLRQFHRQAKRS